MKKFFADLVTGGKILKSGEGSRKQRIFYHIVFYFLHFGVLCFLVFLAGILFLKEEMLSLFAIYNAASFFCAGIYARIMAAALMEYSKFRSSNR